MSRHLVLVVCAALTGCEWVNDLVGVVEAATDPLVVLGAVVCVDLPEGLDADAIAGTGLSPGTSFYGALGDASMITTTPDVTDAGQPGGRLAIEGVEATDHGDGRYVIEAGTLDWRDGETWTLDVDLDGDTGTAWIDLPPAAAWDPPPALVPGEDLVIDLSDQPFDTLLVAVADAVTGEVTWSNQPRTASELLVAARTTGSLIVTVPGATAFPHAGEWLVGVGAAVHTRPGDLQGVNDVLSAVVASRMTVYRVPALDAP